MWALGKSLGHDSQTILPVLPVFGLWRKACLQAPQLGSGREELRAPDSHKTEVLVTTWTLDLSLRLTTSLRWPVLGSNVRSSATDSASGAVVLHQVEVQVSSRGSSEQSGRSMGYFGYKVRWNAMRVVTSCCPSLCCFCADSPEAGSVCCGSVGQQSGPLV